MDSAKITLIMTIACAAVYVLMVASIPLKIKKLKNESGGILLKLSGGTARKAMFVLIFGALLIAVVPLRSFPVYLAAVFLGAALIAANMAVNETANSKLNGVYSNMIISQSQAIKYDDIESLPTLAYENDEDTTMVDFASLEILLKDGRKTQLVFANETERSQAVDAILSVCKRLKP